MNAFRIRTVAIGIAIAVAFSSAASAYVLLSPRRTWDSAPNYVVDSRGAASISDNDGGASRTASAITSNSAWNGGVSGVIQAHVGSVSGWSLGDGVPMLNFQDPQRACRGTCLAATFTGYYSQRSDGTYRIYDADIVTNASYDWTSEGESDGCSGEFYIEGVMVHEAGHGLGLGHTNVSGATMYPSVSSCNNSPATTENDDEAGIQDLYAGGGGGGGGGGGNACANNGEKGKKKCSDGVDNDGDGCIDGADPDC